MLMTEQFPTRLGELCGFIELRIPMLSGLQGKQWIDGLEDGLPALRHFVLPGGHPALSQCHLARTVCRRAERRAVALDQLVSQPEVALRYLNRLSDAFFMLGRRVAEDAGVAEEKWPRTPTTHR